MKSLIVALALALVACNGSETALNEAKACGSKSLFSTWAADVDFDGFDFGTTTYRQDFTVHGGIYVDCEFDVQITGSQCSGTVTYTRGVQVNTGGPTSSYCSDRVGVYEYAKTSDGLVYGRVGTRPIIYQ